MKIFGGFGRLMLAFVCATASYAVLVPQGWAQIGAYGGMPGLNLQATHAPPVDTSQSVDLRQEMREKAQQALILGDWLIFPNAFLGGIYDTNPSQAS
jgi:hypothetical protein